MQSAPRPIPAEHKAPAQEAEIIPLPETGGREKWRTRLLIGLAILVLVAGGAYGARWYMVGRFLVTTDDAYLQADSAVVAPKIAGYIAEVSVADNQMVAKGQVLARIDDRDYRVEVAQAEADVAAANAELGNIAAQIDQQNARLAQSQAELTASNAGAEFARQEAARFGNLVGTGAVSTRQAQQSQSELKRANAGIAEAEAMVDAAKKQTIVLEAARVKATAALQRAQSALDQAKLRLSYTVLTAPMDGAIGDRSARVGQFVQPGTRLLTVVPIHNVYLVANFKETQLAGIYRGEPVKIVLDAYPGLEIPGLVDSIAPGTGAEFALLPPENATGNFTKIVQRTPVKIIFEPLDLGGVELRPGLSATATVDTRSAPPGTRSPFVHHTIRE
jgi:membrane fusion protein (multidrug efflux system)